MHGVWRTLFIVTLTTTGTGCGLLFPRSERQGAEPPRISTVVVEIESHNWNDVTVYLLTGGLPQRLGMVSALSEATFDFSSHRLNTSSGVRLRALPVAGQAFTSEAILVIPGQSIFWTLENNLETSSFTVY